jgi:hypothetical protein
VSLRLGKEGAKIGVGIAEGHQEAIVMSWGVHQRPGGVARKREEVPRQRLAGAKGVVKWGPDRH